MGLFGNLFQQRQIGLSQINNPNIPLFQALTGVFDGSSSGVTVTTATAMRVSAVNACVKLIAETIAALPLQTFNRNDDSREPIRKPSESYVWDQPNHEMTPMEFWEQVFASLLLDGNAFLETPRNRAGAIAEMWPVEQGLLEIERDARGNKVFESANGGVFTTNEIVHMPAFRRPGMDRGMSPIAAARESIGVSIAAERLAAKFFGQGSVLSGLLEVEGDMSDAPEAVDAAIANFNRLHQGPDNAFKVGLIDNNAKFRQLSIPPEDLQFMEARKFQVVEICRMFQVPPHMVADVERSTSWGSGIEQQQLGFVIYTLMRWIVRTEQYITKFLLPTPERFARWNLKGLMRGDSAARAAFYRAMRDIGALNIDEIREEEDMSPLPNGLGQDYLQPLNFAPVGSPQAEGEAAEDDDQPSTNGVRDALVNR